MVTDIHIGEIRTRVAKIWLREDGIVQIGMDPGAKFTLVDTREGLEGIVKVSKGQRRPLLVDARNLKSADFAARHETATFEEITSVAILINSAVSRMILNIFLAANKTSFLARTLYFRNRSRRVAKRISGMNNKRGAEMVTDNRIEEVRTRVLKIWLREDGIVQNVVDPGAEITLADLREGLAGIDKVSKGQRRPLLVDSRNLKSMDRNARQKIAAFEEITSIAILINSAVSRMIGNVFLATNKKSYPARTLYFRNRSRRVVKGISGMTLEAKTTQDPRLNDVLDLILQITSGNLEARGTPSERGDELDAIVTGLNMLGEELSAAFGELREARDVLEERVTERTAELEQAAIRLIKLVNDLEARNREMVLLGEMGNLLQSSLTSEEAYATIKQSVQKLFPDKSGALYIYNASRNLLEVIVAWGETLSSEEFFTQDECQALRNGQIFQVNDLRTMPICQHVQQKVKERGNKIPLPAGYICAPLLTKGKATGIIYLEAVQGSGPLSAKKPLVDAMSEQIMLALTNLNLQEILRGQSVRNSLTGLFNRRYMDKSFGREISRANG